MCSVLEGELNRLVRPVSKRAESVSYIDSFGGECGTSEPWDEKLAELREKLITYAIPELYADVLILKLVCKWGDTEIAKALHMPTGSVYLVWNKGVQLLKERGFK